MKGRLVEVTLHLKNLDGGTVQAAETAWNNRVTIRTARARGFELHVRSLSAVPVALALRLYGIDVAAVSRGAHSRLLPLTMYDTLEYFGDNRFLRQIYVGGKAFSLMANWFGDLWGALEERGYVRNDGEDPYLKGVELYALPAVGRPLWLPGIAERFIYRFELTSM